MNMGRCLLCSISDLQDGAKRQQELCGIVGDKIDKADPVRALAPGIEIEGKHKEIGDKEQGDAGTQRPAVEGTADTEKR